MARGGDRTGIGGRVGRPPGSGQHGSTRVLSIRLPVEYYEEFVRLARQNNRSLQEDCKLRLLGTLQVFRSR